MHKICFLSSDVDECSMVNICPGISQCYNNPGSYRCQCPLGYTGNPVKCTGNEDITSLIRTES